MIFSAIMVFPGSVTDLISGASLISEREVNNESFTLLKNMKTSMV